MAGSNSIAEMNVSIRADIAQLTTGLNKANEQIARFGARTEKELKKTSDASKKTSASMLQMRRNMDTAFRGIAGSFVAREVFDFSLSIAKATSDITMLNQRIKVFTGNSAGFGEAYEAAQALGVAVNNVAAGMGRIVAVGAEMGVTTREARQMTVTFQQLAMLSGSSVKESQAAFIQFTQALSANRLSGEELRSVREQAPLVAQAIAKYMGISIGEIKKVAEEGKITADVMRGAMSQAAEDAAKKFAELPVTLERQQAALANAWQLTLAGLDSVLRQSDMWMFFNTGLTKALESFGKSFANVQFLSDDDLKQQAEKLRSAVLSQEQQLGSTRLPEWATGGARSDLASDRSRLLLINQEIELRNIARQREEQESAVAKSHADQANLLNEQAERIKEQKRLMKELGELFTIEFDTVGGAVGFQTSKLRQFVDALKDSGAIQRQIRNDASRYDDSNMYGMAGGEPILGDSDPTLKAAVQGGFDPGGIKVQVEEIKEQFSQMTEFGIQAAREIQNAFADYLFDPFEDGIKGMLRGFLDVIRRMVAEIMSQSLLTALFGGLAGSSNAFLSGIGKAFGGGRAAGGPVSANKAYVVGEKGPELLVGASGRIVPGTDVGGGGSLTIAPTYNIDARGATQDLAKQLPGILAAHARQTVEMARRAINDDVSRGAFGRA